MTWEYTKYSLRHLSSFQQKSDSLITANHLSAKDFWLIFGAEDAALLAQGKDDKAKSGEKIGWEAAGVRPLLAYPQVRCHGLRSNAVFCFVRLQVDRSPLSEVLAPWPGGFSFRPGWGAPRNPLYSIFKVHEGRDIYPLIYVLQVQKRKTDIYFCELSVNFRFSVDFIIEFFPFDNYPPIYLIAPSKPENAHLILWTFCKSEFMILFTPSYIYWAFERVKRTF